MARRWAGGEERVDKVEDGRRGGGGEAEGLALSSLKQFFANFVVYIFRLSLTR